MPTRTARTAWNGTLETGSGQVELSSSKVGTYEVSFPKRAADEAGGTTSPEELIAAAHSSCFAMQLSANIAEAGGTPQSLEVTADVSLGPGPRDGLMTGLVRRTGRSVRAVRTTIEGAVVVAGVALGGTLGPATLLYAVSIGPLVQLLLPPLSLVPAGGNTREAPELHTPTRP